MCKLFLAIVSLISFVQFSELMATDIQNGRSKTTIKDAASCCTLSFSKQATTAACTANGTITATVTCADSTFDGDTVLFYVTDIHSTTLVKQSAIASGTASVLFANLGATTYTLSAVIMNTENCLCLTDCLSVSLAPDNEVCCNSLDIYQVHSSNEAITLYAAIPHLQLPGQMLGIPFKLKYEWFSSFQPSVPLLGGQMILYYNQQPSSTVFTVYGSGPNDVKCVGCCGCGSTSLELEPTCLFAFEGFPVTITPQAPTSAFACNGSIRAELIPTMPAFFDSVIFCMTDGNFNTVSIGASGGEFGSSVTFSNLTVGNYYLYALGFNAGSLSCMTTPTYVTLSAPMNGDLTICQLSNPACNYVDLIAVPSAPSPCLIQDFIWQMLDSNGNTCVIGTGPVMRVTNSGTYTVTATIPRTEPGCIQNSTSCEVTTICQSSQPVVVTVGSCVSSCSIQFSLCGTTNVCYNLEDQQPFLLCVVLPEGDTATYTYAWSVNGVTLPGETNSFVQIVPSNGIGTYEVCSQITDTATQCVSTSCVSCTLNRPPLVTMPGQCVCAGADIFLEVTTAATSVNCCFNPAAQLFVTGPGCFSFSSPITIGGSVTVPVTSFATEANAGCYYAAIADANGCVGNNFDDPARVVVLPCCPLIG